MSEPAVQVESTEKIASVARIGTCQVCQKMAKVTDDACDACRAQFNPKIGPMARRIRTEPRFHYLCYRAMTTDFTRSEFVKRFGEPSIEVK
jgi:predicted amidophosphoribosyltransferase